MAEAKHRWAVRPQSADKKAHTAALCSTYRLKPSPSLMIGEAMEC